MDSRTEPATAGKAIGSVCVFCGSASGGDPAYEAAARVLGQALAAQNIELVYGGGGVGLMGAAARAAHSAGGAVLGVMPEFLRRQELLYDAVETVVVPTMHERKRIMFEHADAFTVFPGGIGTLEEVVELLSWKRLGLHAKPVVFLNRGAYWKPFFSLISHTVTARFSPGWATDLWRAVDRVEDVLPTIAAELAAPRRQPADVGSKL